METDGSDSKTNTRLDSWKEIARYLDRDVKTAQRWEKQLGLPVRRVAKTKRAPVFAYSSEIDRWLQRQTAEEGQHPSPSKSNRVLLVAASLLLASIVAGLAWISSRDLPDPGNSTRPGWILAPVFEGQVEDSARHRLDQLFTALLTRVDAIKILPADRIEESFRLMRREPQETLDRQDALDVCYWDGDVRAILAARVEATHKKYRIFLELIAPGTGEASDSFEYTVENLGSADLEHRLDGWFRTEFVKAWDRLPPTPLQTAVASGITRGRDGRPNAEDHFRVTTSSAEALRLFRQTVSTFTIGEKAEPVLRRAVELDPDFATAYLFLAYTHRNQNKPGDDHVVYAGRAWKLRMFTRGRERDFIEASYYNMTGDVQKATQVYESLLMLQPDHGWAYSNLLHLYVQSGQEERIGPFAVRLAEKYPRNIHTNLEASQWLLRIGDVQGAVDYLSRAQSLPAEEFLEIGVKAASVRTQIALGDASRALTELEDLKERARSFAPSFPERAWAWLAEMEFALGLTAAAGRTWRQGVPFREVIRRAAVADRLAVLRYAIDGSRARRELTEIYGKEVGGSPPLARQARWAGAEGAAAHMISARIGALRGGTRNWATIMDRFARVPIARDAIAAEAEMHAGRPDEVIRLLDTMSQGYHVRDASYRLAPPRRDSKQTAIMAAGPALTWHPLYFLSVETLSRAWEALGDRAKAIRVLEDATKSSQAVRAAAWGFTYPWMRARLLLARLYRLEGRLEWAKTVEDDLRRRLRFGDDGHPIRAALEAVPAMERGLQPVSE